MILAAQQLPHFDATAATAVRGEPKTAEENALLALSDELVAELKGCGYHRNWCTYV